MRGIAAVRVESSAIPSAATNLPSASRGEPRCKDTRSLAALGMTTRLHGRRNHLRLAGRRGGLALGNDEPHPAAGQRTIFLDTEAGARQERLRVDREPTIYCRCLYQS